MIDFTPKQKEFWRECSKHRWNIKSGATRSGKTYLDYYLIPRRIRGLSGKEGLYVMLGNTKGTMQRNIIEPLQGIWGTRLVSDIRSDNTAFLFGEKVHCIGADKINQVNRLRGSSIKYCYGDEVATWSEDVFSILKSRLDKPYSRFDGTCNPEHPKHWLKEFLDSDADVFSQSYSLYDNTFLDPSVVQNLEIEYSGTVYFDRYILGKWVRAEGLVFPVLADNPGSFEIEPDKVPRLQWREVGFDIGGNGSAYALTCSGLGDDGCIYVLKAQKVQAEDQSMDDLERLVSDFCGECESKWGRVDSVNCDHVAVVVNSINDGTKYRAELCYKPPLKDRPFAITKLLGARKIFFVRGECEDLLDEMSNLVFDKRVEDAIPLDDGSMQIDTWDSFVYSISGNWKYLDF